jgi:hypothetical protein
MQNITVYLPLHFSLCSTAQFFIHSNFVTSHCRSVSLTVHSSSSNKQTPLIATLSILNPTSHHCCQLNCTRIAITTLYLHTPEHNVVHRRQSDRSYGLFHNVTAVGYWTGYCQNRVQLYQLLYWLLPQYSNSSLPVTILLLPQYSNSSLPVTVLLLPQYSNSSLPVTVLLLPQYSNSSLPVTVLLLPQYSNSSLPVTVLLLPQYSNISLPVTVQLLPKYSNSSLPVTVLLLPQYSNSYLPVTVLLLPQYSNSSFPVTVLLLPQYSNSFLPVTVLLLPPAKMGHGPHSSKIFCAICIFLCRSVLLSPGGYPIVVYKYTISYHFTLCKLSSVTICKRTSY